MTVSYKDQKKCRKLKEFFKADDTDTSIGMFPFLDEIDGDEDG